jgi:hypothetical protein
MKRVNDTNEPLSLDSLLDTLMCVVGVSLVILAVSQLQLAKAVQVSQENSLAEEQVTALERSAEQLSSLTSINTNLEETVSKQKSEILLRNKVRKNLLDRIAALKAEEAKLEDLSRERHSAEQIITKLSTKAELYDEEISDLRGQIDLVQEKIGIAPGPMEIRLPVRGRIGKKLDPVLFVCRYGRVFPLDNSELQKPFTTTASAAFKSLKAKSNFSSMSMRARIDHMLAYFKRKRAGNKYFLLELGSVTKKGTFDGFNIYKVPREQEGESIEEATDTDSTFVRIVKNVDPNKQYIKFYVWSDSFSEYLALRRTAEQLHSAGEGLTRLGFSWIPYSPTQELNEFWDILEKYDVPKSSSKGGTWIDNI